MSEMKIGIACDQYKVNRFVKVLKKKNFTFDEPENFTKDVMIIRVHSTAEEIGKNKQRISKICKEVELFFKRGN